MHWWMTYSGRLHPRAGPRPLPDPPAVRCQMVVQPGDAKIQSGPSSPRLSSFAALASPALRATRALVWLAGRTLAMTGRPGCSSRDHSTTAAAASLPTPWPHARVQAVEEIGNRAGAQRHDLHPAKAKHLRIVPPADSPVPDAMPYPVVAPALQELLRCWSVRQRVTGVVGHCQWVLVQAQNHVDVGHPRTAQRQSRRPQTSVPVGAIPVAVICVSQVTYPISD